MKTYRPGPVKSDELRRELNSVVQAANRPDNFVGLVWLSAEPERPFAGMVVLANGSGFDPGSGAGMYVRNEDNDAWLPCF